MPAITKEIVEAAYDYAKKAYLGQMSAPDTAAALSKSTGMNENSAADYVYNLKHILDGNEYKRTSNAAATRHFLQKIEQEFPGVSKMQSQHSGFILNTTRKWQERSLRNSVIFYPISS